MTTHPLHFVQYHESPTDLPKTKPGRLFFTISLLKGVVRLIQDLYMDI